MSSLPLVLTSLSAQALPVRADQNFSMPIVGEYIIQVDSKASHLFLKNSVIERKLGHDLYLISGVTPSKVKAVTGFKLSPNYAYYGEYKDIDIKGRKLAETIFDPDFTKQFHHQMISTKMAWEVTKGSRDLIVAVTDNEFQLDHRDLLTTWWKNPLEVADNGIDDDQNGYIDDVYGWDFYDTDNNVDSTTEPTHGTHVAGIIAATTDNEFGGAGIAPNVKVMPLKWYGAGRAWTSAMISETYHYAVDNGAKIISTSYNIDGLIDDQVYLDAIKYIRDNDVLLFNSAGNGRKKNPPRQVLEEVILVCSVKSKSEKKQDKKSSFSNYGTGIDICAPGDPVYSTVQAGASGVQSRYGMLQGTSMATPAAAAVAALIWSAHPNFSDEEVRQKLYDSADEIDSKNFWYRKKLGAGRINALRAVQ